MVIPSRRDGRPAAPWRHPVLHVFLVFWCMLAAVPVTLASVFMLPADEEVSAVNLLPYVTYLEDPARDWRFDSARQRFAEGQGKVWPESLFNAGFSESRWWFHVSLENPESRQRQVFIEIDYPLLDRVDAYCGPPGGRYVLSRMGDHVHFDTRDLIVRNHVIPLAIDAKSRRECFIRVESTSNIAFPVTLSDVRPFIENSREADWRLGAFYGIALALLVYNLLVFIASRERLYLYYVLHVFASACYNSLLDGSWGHVWSALGIGDYWLMVFIVATQAAALLFAREYLDYHDPFHPVSRIISASLFLLLAEVMAIPFVELPVIARVILYTTLLVSILVLTLGVLRWRESPRTAIPFVLGFGAVVSMAIGASLASLGWFSSVVITTYGMKWAWAFELAMLSTGLGLRIEDMKRRQFNADLDHAESDARSQARNMVLSSMYDTLREPVESMVDLGGRLSAVPLAERDRRHLESLRMASLLVSEHLARMGGPDHVADEPETVFDWWALAGGCAGMFAPRIKAQGGALTLSMDAGTPREIITRQAALRHLVYEIMSKVARSPVAKGFDVRLGLTDDIHDERLWLKLVIDVAAGTPRRPSVSRTTLSEQGQACLEALDARCGWSNPSTGTGAWLVVPVSVPDDVESASDDGCVDLLADDVSTIAGPVPADAGEDLAAAQVASQTWAASPSAAVAATSESAAGQLPLKATAETVPGPVRAVAGVGLESTGVAEGLRVLLAEDNQINQKVIMGFLVRLGADVKIVADGRQAVEGMKAAGAHYDLVLMDCQMPVMNGFDAMRAIRAWEVETGREPVPAIGLSAHSGEEWRKQGENAGLDVYLTKPLTFRGVAEAIRRVQSRGSAR